MSMTMKRRADTKKPTATDVAGRDSSPGSSNRLQRVLLVALLILAAVTVAWVHWPVLSASALSFDDEFFVTKNPLVQNPSWASVGRFFSEVLTPSTVGGYYLPLSMTSLMLDYAMGGRPNRLAPFHRTSLLLHGLNTLLVILLLYLLFGNPVVAALVGLMFGVHPLTVEPIAWVGERKTLLAAFFALLSIIAFVRFAASKDRKAVVGAPQTARARIWYGLCLLCYLLSVLSKPTSVPLPALLLLLDYWPLHRLSGKTVVEKIPLFAIAAGSAVVTLLSTAYNSELTLLGQRSITAIPLRICYLLLFYLRKMVWPGRLSSAYAIPEPIVLSDPAVVISLLGTLVLVIGVALSWRRTRALITGAVFFVVAIFPVLGVVGYSWVSASDKYVYLPALGVLIVLARLLGRAWSAGISGSGGSPAVRALMCTAILIICVAEVRATRNYLHLWQNTETLYRHMIEDAPPRQAWALHYTLGNLYMEQGRIAEAVPCFERAVESKPDSVFAHNNLGLALARQNHPDAAAVHYRRALELDPDYAQAHNNLGSVLARQGRMDQAGQAYREALRLKPDYLEARINLANVLAIQGLLDDAVVQLRRALELNPGEPATHYNLANILATQARNDEAVRHYEHALLLRPDYLEAHSNLAIVLVAQNRLAEAVGHFRRALQLRPDVAGLHLNLADALLAQGQVGEAVDHYREVVRIQPRDPDARCRLGTSLQRLGRREEAIAQYREALRIDPGHESARRLLDAVSTQPTG